MNFLTQIAVLAAETVNEEGHGNVMLDTFIFGLIAAAVFFLLAMVALSYRNVANRHTAKAEAWAAKHGAEHGAVSNH